MKSLRGLRLHPHRPAAVRLAALLLSSGFASAVFGQQTTGRSAGSTDADETVVLSPFEVNAEQDTGYAASGTLMGTRLRTELKDIASSISAITKDFMADINATDLEGLLVYTTGTEVGGVRGNFSAAVDNGARNVDFDAGNRDATSTTRVRGLGSADLTRDYFLTDVAMDSYIVDRVEISRGPNSMLYGLGAPAGIINSTTIKADTARTRARFSQQFGSYGTSRTTMDHNQVIIKDKLAIRVAALYGDRRYRIEDTFERSRRGFGTLTYRPFTNTMIRANFETGENTYSRPRNATPYDNFSYWWALGQQTFDPTTGVTTLLGTRGEGQPNLAVNALQFGDVAWRAGIVYSDPTSSTPGIGIPGSTAVAMTTRSDRVRINPANGQLIEGAMGALNAGVNYRRGLVPTTDPGRQFYRWLAITDPEIFDFYHYQIDGPNSNRGMVDWDTINASVEQRFFNDKLGFEAAYNHESQNAWNSVNSTSGEYNIFVDINTKLLDGTTNPNFGRPLMAATGANSDVETARDAKRLTGYYDLDLRDKGPELLGTILGRHVFTAAYTDQEYSRFRRTGRPVTLAPDYELFQFGSIATKSSPGRSLARLSYLGPAMTNLSGAREAEITPVSVIQNPVSSYPVSFRAYAAPAAGSTALNPWTTSDFSILVAGEDDVEPTVSSVSRQRQEVKSSVLVSSNRWLNDKVITTFGWRRDEWKNYQSGTSTRNPATGTELTSEADLPAPLVAAGGREDHSNYGIAIHVPDTIRKRLPLGADMSFYINRADNFRPELQRYNVYNEQIGAQSGSTKEYGGRLSLLDRKFELRATYYETAAQLAVDSNTNSTVSQINDRMEGIIEAMYTPGGFYEQRWGDPSHAEHSLYLSAKNALDAWLVSPGAIQFMDTFRYAITTEANGNKIVNGRDNRGGEVVNTTDTTSKGWEFEAVINPTRNWQIALSAAKQQAIRTHSSLEIAQLVDNVFTPLWNGPLGQVRSTINTSFNFYDNAVGTVYSGLNRARALDGAYTPEVREWRWSAVTRYNFREGRLKGFGVGGSVRWESAQSIGYPYAVADNGTAIIDVGNPFFGDDYYTYDAFVRYTRKLGKRVNWTIQVHLRNIGVGNELIPTYANPDGSYSAFRIREPQNWSISNSFEF